MVIFWPKAATAKSAFIGFRDIAPRLRGLRAGKRCARCSGKRSTGGFDRRRYRDRRSIQSGAVLEVNHAVAEAPFGHQIESEQNVVRQGLFAASHQDERDNQMVFVH